MIIDWHLSIELCKACVAISAMLSSCPPVQLTANEQTYLPTLQGEIESKWPSIPRKAVLAAQVRQETCPSLKSKMCWSPHAELKTSREYGFGLGQITITSKFDNFKEAKKLDGSLKNWAWENRYNAEYQLRTLVLTDMFNYGKFDWAGNNYERMAFSLAAYNGGIGGVLSDRRVCAATAGCNQDQWFGHVALTSKKAKVAANGYGESFFQINRGYVEHGMVSYVPRYEPFFEECNNVQ